MQGRLIKIRLAKIGKRQVDLVDEINRRKYTHKGNVLTVFQADMSNLVNDRYIKPKSEAIYKAADEVLTDWEKGGQA